jgi:poly(beta-D-mannuronate) lyase
MLAVFAILVTSCALVRALPDPPPGASGEILLVRDARLAALRALSPEQRHRWCGTGQVPPEAFRPVPGLRDRPDGPDPASEPFAAAMMALAAAGFGAEDADARRTLVELLGRWSRANALSASVRSVNGRYALDRTLLPTIVAFALVRDDPVWSPTRREAVAEWLERLVRSQRQQPRGPASARNNHHYLRASVEMAWGALIGDTKGLAAGDAAFRDALQDMRADGSLPLETRRGARALWYQRHAVASLVVIAEIAAVHGQDLYGIEVGGRSLHTAIRFLLDGIAEPRRVWRYAAANDKPGPDLDPHRQDLGFLEHRGHGRHYMAWAEIYMARFPDRAEARRLRALLPWDRPGFRPTVDDYSGGNTTCFFAPGGA